jgi:serine/threonine-protein kinase
VQVTAQLTHPNTVQVYDYGRTADGTFYYAMEYLPGLTLEQLVRQNGAISPERTVHFLKQICGALSEAHKAGLIHRDIKPGNILICERGGRPDVAKLLDFGLVGALNAGEGNIVGTPQYMSPEQASGRSLDARSDLYSLGAVGYFLLCGEPPFANRTIIELLRAHISEAIPFPDTVAVPEQLKAIILRCLSKDPAERYPDATSLDQALSNCLM